MFSEDLSIFTDPNGLGNSATVGTGFINGIFERQFAEVRGVEGYYPTYLVTSADAENITKNETSIILDTVEYKAISKRPDGTGMVLLILEAV